MGNYSIGVKIFFETIFKGLYSFKNWAFMKTLLSTLKSGVEDHNILAVLQF